ncbi:peptidoglycan-associated lipoprotein Pal [Pseudobacteriovorax antillogorgiicola]|uniref:Peptidoglycan-associated lipoprotein n=1 Tax=Pseudobacteriovorax antillogorgiicola TaxID=1513793 RepID=A0A1Y6BAF0_9BACT|nr:peptidoglycan-associated lipoprotein Pal [Pseudobacteriovorax antillogorgiicola]TCS59238.1 peptidoglycan-associated lipoprotein [Pseudobacteriovorax antillogorgiicola]SME90270.1 peptidoglycan-associated lipoprotein [Pseudobacteriovorax antillogorgiicola]
MTLKKTWKPIAVLVLSLGLGFGCAEDQQPAEEVVQPTETEEPAAPPEEMVSVEEVTQPVYFAFDDYTLSISSQDSLSQLADYLKNNTAAVVQVEGHADERGSIEYNLALGQRRAQSVKNYLVELGIDPSRLPTMSYGEERPAVEGSDEGAWEKNRRAEFVLSNP